MQRFSRMAQEAIDGSIVAVAVIPTLAAMIVIWLVTDAYSAWYERRRTIVISEGH